MKKVLFFLLLSLSIPAFCIKDVEIDGCEVTITDTFAGEQKIFYAYGNVYVVTDPKEPADLKVYVSSSPSSCCIYRCKDKPQDCGEWRFVKNRKDAKFTIRYVKQDDDYDCRIRFTNNRSGASFSENYFSN
ncbi:MAG: hypothetical protein NDJ65_04595 [Paludibacteraceae bacterium]|nr:hypothetical protein [Paludibacteraceae bacterium]